MIKGAFNLKNLMGMIAHYITFSIGVQMVMQIRQGISNAIESFKAFERAAANAAVVSGYIGGSFDDISGKMMNLSKVLSRETVYSAKEIQEAFYQISSAGIDIAKVTKGQLIPILNYAAATQADLAIATEDVLTSMKAFGLEMDETARIADVFTEAITSSFFNLEKMGDFMKYVAPIAGALGVSLEETVAAGMLLVDMGMQGGMAGQRLNMVFTKLLDPSEKAEDTLAGLGLTMEDLNPEIYTFTEILYKLKAAGFGAAEAAALFRSRTASAAAVLVEGAYEIDRYNQQLKMSQGITESVAAAQENTLYGSMKLLSNAIEEVSISIGATLAPMISDISKNMEKFLPTITNVFKSFLEAIPSLIKFIKIFVSIKVAFMAFKLVIGLVSTLMTLFGNATIFASITQKNLIAQVYLSVKAFLTQRVATDAAKASMAKLALFTSLVTFGLSAVAGVAVLSAMHFFTLTDAAIDLTSSHKDLGESIEGISGDNYIDILHSLTAWEVGLWDITHSNKTFIESIASTNDALSKFSEDYKNLTEVDMIKLAIEISNPNYLQDALNMGLGTIEPLSIPIDDTFSEGFAKKIQEQFEIIDKGPEAIPFKFEGIKNEFDIAKEFFAKFMKIPISEITNNLDLVSQALKVITGKTLEDIQAQALFEIAIVKTSGDLVLYRSSLEDLKQSIEDQKTVTNELNAEKSKESKDLTKIMELEEKYVKVTDKRVNSTQNLLSSMKGIITEIRSMGSVMDQAVQTLEDSYKANMEFADSQRELEEATRDQEKSLLDLSEALAIYGVGSNEAINAERSLTNAIKDRMDLQEKVSSLDTARELAEEQIAFTKAQGVSSDKTLQQLTDLGYGIKQIDELTSKYSLEDKLAFLGVKLEDPTKTIEYMKLSISELQEVIKKNSGVLGYFSQFKTLDESKALNVTMKLTDAQKELFDITHTLTDAREDLYRTSSDQSIAEAKLNALYSIQENFTKYLSEKSKNYLEVLQKIYDIKLKLYKIEEDQQKQYGDLFDKLAEEGMIDEEIIKLYSEMENAKGEQLAANKPFIDMYGKLQQGERDLVNEYIKGNITRDELVDKLYNVKDAYYKMNKDDKTYISEDELDIITRYKDASDKLNKAIAALGDKFGPLIPDLQDIGAISSEAADAYSKLADNTLEVAKNNVDLVLAYAEIKNQISSMVGNTTRLAKSFMDLKDESMIDVFDEMISKLELTGKITGKTGDKLKILNKFFYSNDIKKYKDNIDEFSEAELIAFLTMADMAQDMNLWEDGMSGAALATTLGASSLSEFVNAAIDSTTEEQSMYELTQSLESAVLAFDNAMGSLNKTLEVFLELTLGIDPIITAMNYNFSNLVSTFGDMDSLFMDVAKRNLSIPNVMENWEESDWIAWSEQIKKTPELLNEMKEEMGSIVPEFNIITTWNEEDWTTWYGELSNENKSKIDDALNDYATVIEFHAKCDGFSFQDYINNQLSGPLKQQFLEKVSEMSGQEIGIVTKWDDEDWANFCEIMGSEKLNELQGILDDNRLTLFIDYSIGELPDIPDIPDIPKVGTPKSSKGGDIFGDIWKIITDIITHPLDYGPWNVGGAPWSSKKPPWESAEGMVALQKGITKTKGPQQAIIGEAGAEAVVPLEGKNKKYGQSILQKIIPKYFPGLKFMAEGYYPPAVFPKNTPAPVTFSLQKNKTPEVKLEDETTKDISENIGLEFRDALADIYTPNISDTFGPLKDLSIGIRNGTTTFYNSMITVGNQLYENGKGAGLQLIYAADKYTTETGAINDKFIGEMTTLLNQIFSTANYTGPVNEPVPEGYSGKAYWTGKGWSPKPEDFNKYIAAPIKDEISQLKSELVSKYEQGNPKGVTPILNRIKELEGALERVHEGDMGAYYKMIQEERNASNKADLMKLQIDKMTDQLVGMGYSFIDAQNKANTKVHNAWAGIDDNVKDTNTILREKRESSRKGRNLMIGPGGSLMDVSDTGGNIWGLKKGAIVNKPTFGMFGEAGAEAIVPLERNRKFGANILKSIIPSYYPDLFYKAQAGGIFGGSTTSNVSYGGNTYNESMNMTGPINVNGVQDVNSFMKQLQMRARASRR